MLLQWWNYHLTRSLVVFDHRRFNADGKLQPTAGMSGAKMFAASAPLLMRHAKVAARMQTRCGLIGKAWSFTSLTGNDGLQLDCGGKLVWEAPLTDGSGLSGITPFDPSELGHGSSLSPGHLAWVRGGTTMRDIAIWAEDNRLSLMTSGDQLGPSLAGAIATGTHGSRLNYGAIQNMVRGMHIITGADSSVWIEPASQPALSDAIASTFADQVIRNDDQFADALIHLGAMGIVNGMVIELEPKQLFNKFVAISVLEPLWDEWLEAVMARDFARVAQILGWNETPIFYEFSLNPFDPKGAESVHIFYSVSHAFSEDTAPGRTPRPADAIYLFAQMPSAETPAAAAPKFDLPTMYVALVRSEPLTQLGASWKTLHKYDVETGGRGALFNAGFGIPFAQLPDAIEAMCGAVVPMNDDRQFVFTYRFVTKAAGTLAHLRWEESVAIELDGASVLNVPRFDISPNSAAALFMIQQAFQKQGLDYAMHWAKFGNSAASVAHNFGHRKASGSAVDRWRKTREALLDREGRQTMQNDLVVQYRLV